MSMRRSRSWIPVILTLLLVFSLIPGSSFAAGEQEGAEWWNYRNNYENNGVTDRATPNDAKKAALKWGKKLGTGWAAAPTPPIIVDGKVYVVAGNKVHALDRETGEILKTSEDMKGSVSYAMNPPLYAEGKIFVPLNNGIIQALDADTLKVLWSSENVGGQSQSPIAYRKIDGEGHLFMGTWTHESRDGTFIAVTTEDEDPERGDEVKNAKWKFVPSRDDAALADHPAKNRGFYWAGAYATENYVAVGSDDGTAEGEPTDNAVFYTLNPRTGEIIDRIDGIKGDIRTTTAYDNGHLYFSTKGGDLYRVPVDADGKLGEAKKISLGGMTTATPVVYGDKIYIGVCGPGGQFSADGGHRFAVIKNVPGEELTEEYSLPIPGYPQAAALLSTAYEGEDFNGDGNPDGRVYIYFTYNAQPGGIYYTYYEPGMTQAPEAKPLFTPPVGMQQYCISTIIADNDGTLYYKNDSLHVMAVETNPAYLEGATIEPDVGDAVWSENFDSSVDKYTVKVKVENDKVKLKLDMPEGVTATVNDVAYDAGGTDLVLDENGKHEATIKVSKGEYARTYTITVERESQVAYLKALKVNRSNSYTGAAYTLIPEFNRDVHEYATEILPHNRNFYNVWPEAEHPDAKVQVFPGENVDTSNTGAFIEETGEYRVTAYDSQQGYPRYAVYADNKKLDSTVLIRVTSESGEFQKEYTLTLSRTVDLVDVGLSPETLEVVKGETGTLTPLFNPANASFTDTTWSSADESIATVADGTVTGVEIGETTVTVTTIPAPTETEGKTATATVKVISLNDYKDKAKTGLDTYKDPADYRDEQKTELANAVAAGKDAIDAATDKAGVDTAVATAREEMDKIKTNAQLTEEENAAAAVDAKIEAIGEVTLESKGVIDEARTAYNALSQGAKDKVTKLSVLEAAEARWAELKQAADDLANAKEAAKAELDSYDLEGYEDAEKAEVQAIIAAAKVRIDSAETEEQVAIALNDAKSKIGRVPTAADLQLEKDTEVKVYVTMAKDGTFKIGNDRDATILGSVPFKVGYFDLKQYGLEEFYYKDDEGNIVERPTVLHAFIKFTEEYYLGGEKLEIPSEGMTISGSSGSSYLTKFFGEDENLNYYVNYKYPLESEGWGATSDRILLNEGDKVSVGFFSDWGFWMEGASFMHFDDVEKTVEVGKPLNSIIKGTSADWNTGETLIMPKAGEKILVDGVEKTTSGEEGEFTLTFDEPGTYYVTSGSTSPNNNFLVPAAMTVTVTEKSLDTLKEEAKEELDGYKDPADYRDEQKTELANAIADGKEAIDAAEDQAGIDAAVAAAKEAMDQIKTDAQMAQEETEAAAEVDAMIDAIGEVTLDSKETIETARAAYEALTDGAKDKVTKLPVLEAAEAKLAELEEAVALAEAKETAKAELDEYKNPEDYRDEQKTELANAIADGKAAVDAAENQTGIDAAVAAAKEAMDQIKTDAQLTEEENIAEAEGVEAMIDAIGEVTLEKKDAIEAAREAYENLSDEAKEKVSQDKLSVLEAAEARLAQLIAEAEQEEIDQAAADAVAEKIRAIGDPDLSKEELVEEAREAFDALTPEQKALLPEDADESVLEAAEDEIEDLLSEPRIDIDYGNSSETDGANAFHWVKGESESLIVCVDAEFDTFLDKVVVDGEVLDPVNYTATPGSIIVEFHKAYLDGLTDGQHSFEVYTAKGYAAGTFMVSQKEEPGDPVESGVDPKDPTDPGKTDLTDKTGTESSGEVSVVKPTKTDDPVNTGIMWIAGLGALLIIGAGIRSMRKN